MKIRFVQLDSDVFLTDVDLIQMSPAKGGVHCSLVFFSTFSDGECGLTP